MDRNEGIIRWCPHPGHHDFLTINVSYRLIQMYKAGKQVDPKSFSFEKSSKHNEFHQLTCYDWSPVVHGLVAVGTARGDVQLLRVDDDSNDAVALPLKLGRACQSVAFNTLGHLAVALDRVRNDQCLQIWDINHRLSKWDPSKKGWTGVSQTADPILKLEPSVSVTSTRFFEDQPQTLVAGIKHSSVRIHDLRDPHNLVLQFPTKCNNNLAIDYRDPNYFASSSLDKENDSVVVWDKRVGPRRNISSIYQESVEQNDVPWGGVLRLSNAFGGGKPAYIKNLRYCRDQRGRLGMLSGAGQFQVLDIVKEYTEHMTGEDVEDSPELLQVKKSWILESREFEEEKSQLMSFDWMTLGTQTTTPPKLVGLRANGSLEMFQMPSKTAHLHSELIDFEAPAKFSNTELPNFADPQDREEILGPILLENKLSPSHRPGSKPPLTETATDISSRQHIQSSLDSFPADANVLKNAFISLSSDRLSAPVSPGSKVAKVQPGLNESDIDHLDSNLSQISLAPKKPWSSRVRHEQTYWGQIKRNERNRANYRDRPMHRVKSGYLFDGLKNAEIVSDDPWLQDVWTWIAGAEEATRDEGMLAGNLDLSYTGVHTIWANKLGAKYSSRLLDGMNVPSAAEWEQAIGNINVRAGRGKWEGTKTSKPHHRQLCLAISGWEDTRADLDGALAKMEANGEYTKAAAWALFDQSPKRAVSILKRGGKDLLFIAMALEIQYKGHTSLVKSEWEESFRDHPQMAEDPYLRAIYAFIGSGDWPAIAHERSLPLRDRVAVALQHLTDDELTKWLEDEMEEAIKTGDIEGIVLSGITDSMIDILEEYISKFNDLQTAVLIMSYCAPRYIDDYRFSHWRRDYRNYLNKNKLFIERCKYDTRSIKMSRKRDGTTVLKPPPRQVTIRCLHCDNALTHDLKRARAASEAPSQSSTSNLAGIGGHSVSSNHTASTALPPSTTMPTLATGGSNTSLMRNPLMSGLSSSSQHMGIACSRCGRHLPRCAICMRHLGMPRSGRPEFNTEPQKRLATFFSFCLKCRHAFHADHAAAWFARHLECPHPECRCECRRDEGLMA